MLKRKVDSIFSPWGINHKIEIKIEKNSYLKVLKP